MKVEKIHIKPKPPKAAINEQGCVKLDRDARAMVAVLMSQTGHDAKYIVSEIVKQSIIKNLVVFDKEGE
jgi:hypothetical protein